MLWLCFGWMAKYSKLETLLCKYTAKHQLSQPVNKKRITVLGRFKDYATAQAGVR